MRCGKIEVILLLVLKKLEPIKTCFRQKEPMRRGKDHRYKEKMGRMFPEEAGSNRQGTQGCRWRAGFHLCLIDRELGEVLRWNKRNGKVVHRCCQRLSRNVAPTLLLWLW